MNSNSDNIHSSSIQNILIVEDEIKFGHLLSKTLSKAGYICSVTDNGARAVEKIETGSFDLVLSDIVMPEMDGIQLLKKIKPLYPGIDFIIMTGYASRYSYVEIMNAGASDYLTKPFDMLSLVARIDRIAREGILFTDYYGE